MEMNVHFIKKHRRTITAVLGVPSVILVCDFVLLVTSLGLHWWRLPWGTATSRIMLIVLVILSLVYITLYALAICIRMRTYRKGGYDASLLRELFANAESMILLTLSASWGLLVLNGRPSMLPLKLLALVWIGGFVGFVVLKIYELRRGTVQKRTPL